MTKRSHLRRATESLAETRRTSQPRPPVPKPVLLGLYRALLCAQEVRRQPRTTQSSVPDGMIVAATLPLRPRDLLIPPADTTVYRKCQMLGNSRRAHNRFPQVLHVSPAAHWQVAMAMHLAHSWRQRRPLSTVLALVGEDLLAGAQEEATLQLLGEVCRQRLPVVYVTRTLKSRGARGASELHARGIPRIAVDGSDVVAIYRVCQEALRRAREGTGPTVVDCHFMGSSDPVAFMESFLNRYGMWSPAWKQQLLSEFHEIGS